MRKLIFVVGLLLVALPAKAKDIYISQGGGGNGTSCGSANSLVWFNSSANWGTGSTQIGPGTTVHLCSTFTGVAGANLLKFEGSGTSGSPITLLFESGAVLQATYFGNGTNGAINLNGKSWIIVDGGAGHGVIQATDNGSLCTLVPKPSPCFNNAQKSLAINAGSCSNCEIRNLTIANMYQHTSSVDNGVNFFNDGCIFFGNGSQQSNVSIHDNIMHDAHWCISVNFGNGDDNFQVYNNNISRIDHGVVFAQSAGNTNVASNFALHDNHIFSFANWDTSTDTYHHDGIHVFDLGTGTINGLSLYNNLFEGPVGQCCITGYIYLQSGATGVVVFNNVLLMDGLDNTTMNLQNSSSIKTYNNTIVGASNASGGGYCSASEPSGSGCGDASSGTLTGQEFKNNVTTTFHELMGLNNVNFSTTSDSPDYNIYADGGSIAWLCESGSTKNFYTFSQFSSWKSCLSTVLHSSAADSHSSAPASAGLSSTGVPQAGSPVIGAGTNLTSLCTGNLVALCKDTSAGNTRTPVARPTTGAWDVGAYKF